VIVPENCTSLRSLDASLSTFTVATTFDLREVTIYRQRKEEDNRSPSLKAEIEALWFRTFKVNVGGINLSAIEGGNGGGNATGAVSGGDMDVFRVALTKAAVNLNLNVSMPVDGKYAEVLREQLDVSGLGLVVKGSISPLVLRLDERRYVLLKAVASGNFGDQRRHGSDVANPTPLQPPASPTSSSDDASSSRRSVSASGGGEEVAFNYGNVDAPVNEITVNIMVEQAGIQVSFLRTKPTRNEQEGGGGSAYAQSLEFGDENGNPCIELNMNDGELSYHRATNLHSSFDISLQACSLKDLRPNRFVRALISPARNKDGASASSKPNLSPQIVFHMANRLSEGKSIDVILNRTLVNVAYDPLICFYAFLLTTSASVSSELQTTTSDDGNRGDASSSSSSASSSSSSDTKEGEDKTITSNSSGDEKTTPVDPPPQAATTTPNLKVKLLLHNPMICFWEDERSKQSKILSLRGLAVIDIVKQYSSKKSERMSLRVDKLESFMLDSRQQSFADGNNHIDTTSSSKRNDEEDENDEFEDARDETDHVQFSHHNGDNDNDDQTYAKLQQDGCSLLEPVSMHMVIERTSEPLHPTKRDLNLSLEPISLRFSKENVLVLSAIIESWSKTLKATLEEVHIDQKLNKSSAIGGTSIKLENDGIGNNNLDNEYGDGNNNNNEDDDVLISNGEYVVCFEQDRLGLTLQRLRGSQLAFVENFHKVEPSMNPLIDAVAKEGGVGKVWKNKDDGSNGLSESNNLDAEGNDNNNDDEDGDDPLLLVKASPDIGDIIIAVGDDSVVRNSYDTTIQMIRTSPRPLKITFRRPSSIAATPSSSSSSSTTTTNMNTTNASAVQSVVAGGYVLKVDSGRRVSEECAWNEVDTYIFNRKSLDGLSLSKGGDGEMLVVKNTDAFIALHINEHGASLESLPRMPRPGAVLVAIDGVSVEGIGFERCVSILQGNNNNDISYGGGSNGKSSPRIISSNNVLVLRWREIEHWPHKDTVSLSCAGFEVLLVDDEKFRAVPLIRLGLGTATVTKRERERGNDNE
jgi:hypothetical protein